MGRDEVLEYVQTFTEVRGDRRFDNGAIRLRHQTTHTRQLTNLCRRTTRTGVGHHIDAIKGNLLLFFAVTVDNGFGLQVVHHRLGYAIVRRGPDIDDFVIAFARGNQARLELLLDLGHFRFGFGDDLGFFRRDNHIVDTNGRTRTCCIRKTGIHGLVSKNNGRLQAQNAVTGVQHFGDRFFTERLVHDRERQTFRYDHPQDGTANRGVDQAGFGDELAVRVFFVFSDTNFYASVQFSLA